MADLLNMDYINSLPQPFFCRQYGDQGFWPVHDIEVATGLVRIDVVGKLQAMHIDDIAEFHDADGLSHVPDEFYANTGDTP